MVVVFVAVYFLLNKYPAGSYLYGVGSNEEALPLPVFTCGYTKFLTYMLSGFTAVLSSVMSCSRLLVYGHNLC